MISFREFMNGDLLFEGGNVQIGDVAAERIDLKRYNRDVIVKSIDKGLRAINKAFEKKSGVPLWSEDLLKSLDYLSGSARHFFNLSIPTDEFVKFKPTVGDIDTQIDGAMVPMVKEFLDGLSPGMTLGTLTWVGYKPSGDQFITLWKSDFGVPTQIDMEFVEFSNGKPTQWSQMSHASAWEDMTKRIKGAASKFLARAITSRTEQDIVILKGKKRVPKEVTSALYAASLKGIRNRIQPVTDLETGKQMMYNGKPVFTEIPSKGATFHTDLDVYFRMLFGSEVQSKSDLDALVSFTGLINLIKQYLPQKSVQKKIVDRFVELLFGKGAQGLYRGNKLADFREKTIMLRYICKELNLSWTSYIPMIKTYYRSYK